MADGVVVVVRPLVGSELLGVVEVLVDVVQYQQVFLQVEVMATHVSWQQPALRCGRADPQDPSTGTTPCEPKKYRMR